MLQPTTDLNGQVKVAAVSTSSFNSLPDILTAGGNGDNVAVAGQTIDRSGYDSAVLAIMAQANLTADKVLTVATTIEESANGSNWDAPEVVHAAETIVSGTGRKWGCKQYAIDLKGRKQYVRFGVTPNLTANNTDVANFAAICVLGGAQVLPAV